MAEETLMPPAYTADDVLAALKKLMGDWNYAINTMTSAGCDLNGYLAGMSKAEHDIACLIKRFEQADHGSK